MPSVFLSHNSADKPFVRRLSNDLEALNIQTWVDEAEMLIGDSLIEKIQAAISLTDFVAVVLSRNSVNAPWVKRELEMALSLETSGHATLILPLRIDSCEVPLFLAGRKYSDFSDKERYLAELDLLARSVRKEHDAPIRVRTHRAFFEHDLLTQMYMINVFNQGGSAVEITHVGFRSPDRHTYINVHPIERRLPVLLPPQRSWETWVQVDRLPPEYRDRAFDLFWVRLSSLVDVRSRRNRSVPPHGPVPGGRDLTDSFYGRSAVGADLATEIPPTEASGKDGASPG